MSLCVCNAEALSSIRNVHNVRPTYSEYRAGYRHGKSAAYNNVARTAFFVGTAVIAGVVIYKLGQESRWTAHDGQVGYRF